MSDTALRMPVCVSLKSSEVLDHGLRSASNEDRYILYRRTNCRAGHLSGLLHLHRRAFRWRGEIPHCPRTKHSTKTSVKSSSPFYDYYLEIHVNETYNYYFTDEEGDTCNINTFTLGSHIVRFNSKKPTIVRVKGS